MKFQEDFESLALFNPMAHSITIASFCNLYYRKLCLIPKANPSEPVRGWCGKGRVHSQTALEWLYWREHCQTQNEPQTSRTKDQIAHAGNQEEHALRIGGSKVYVDGFDRSQNKVYEFLGDFYHGSPVAFPNRQMQSPFHSNKTMQEVYEETQERIKTIEEAGYHEARVKSDEEGTRGRERVCEPVGVGDSIGTQRCLFWWKNQCRSTVSTGSSRRGEEIRYADYTSLYPWVNKNCVYPEHSPSNIEGSRCIDSVFCVGEMYRVTTLRFTFCRVASSLWWQVNVSSMQNVRGDPVTVTASPKNPLLPSQGGRTSLDGHVVYARIASCRSQGLDHRQGTQSVALSRTKA